LDAVEEQLDAQREQFNTKFDEDTAELLENVQADIDDLKKPMKELDIQLLPGEGIVDGELQQAPGFIYRMKSAGGNVQSWGGSDNTTVVTP